MIVIPQADLIGITNLPAPLLVPTAGATPQGGPAPRFDVALLEAQAVPRRHPPLGGRDQRLERQVLAVRPGPPAGDGVDRDDPGAAPAAADHGLGRIDSSARKAGVSTWPTRATSMLIS